jgi:hypothetical protein
MQICPRSNQTYQNRSHKPRPMNYVLKDKFLIINTTFFYISYIILVQVFFHCHSFTFDIYLSIVNNKFVIESKTETPEIHNPVLTPISEFLALVLLGVT